VAAHQLPGQCRRGRVPRALRRAAGVDIARDVPDAGGFGGVVSGDGLLEGDEVLGGVEARLVPQPGPVLARCA
jgi:hypothetical protein